jgi:Flp pilus assembly protein TadG
VEISPAQKIEGGERGQSLVELAISLIVILFLLMGAVEFSLALFQYVAMRDAAQDGAIYGSVNPDQTANIKERVKATASDILVLEDSDITVTFNNGNLCEGFDAVTATTNSITVEVKYGHQIFLPLVTPMIGTDTINLTANATNAILTPQCE